jgi:hypothetical protein
MTNVTETRILVLASYQYLDYPTVLATLTPLAPASFHVASQIGVGHSLLARMGNHQLDVTPLKWQPTRPHLEVRADRAILFWDGHDKQLLPSVVILKKASVPMTIVGPDGKVVDLTQFCATLTHSNGNGNGGKVTSTAAPAAPAPAVIVDPPSKDSKVRIQLHIPEATAILYEAQAKLVKQPVEKVMSDRLRTCVNHTSGRGLYFNDAQRSELERVTGGHLISDADTALQKIKVVVQLKVGDIEVALTGRVLERAMARAKSERRTLEDYVRKEVIQGLERSTGLRPW